MNGETNHVRRFEYSALVKTSVLTKLICRFPTILIKIPPGAFVNIDRLMVIFLGENTDPRPVNIS